MTSEVETLRAELAAMQAKIDRLEGRAAGSRRVAALREGAASEAAAEQTRKAKARAVGTMAITDSAEAPPRRGRPRMTVTHASGESGRAEGGPCFMCGVKRADHDALGCKRWRERS